MARDLWYYSRDGVEKAGPTPGDRLRQWIGAGHLTEETLVWRPGMDDWTPLQQVSALRARTPQSPPAAPAAAEAPDPDSTLLLAMAKRVRDEFSVETLRRALTSKVLWFCLVAPLTVIKLVIAPAIISRVAATVADEVYGIEMSVEGWSAGLLDLSATAKNAVISIPGPYAETEFLTAEAIEVDFSLWHRIKNKRWVREIQVKQPKVYVERLLSGRWNWQDLMGRPIRPPEHLKIKPSPKPEQERSGNDSDKGEPSGSESSDFLLSGFSVQTMGLEWVENLPGNSGGGMIQDLKTKLYIDDISVTAKNLVGLVSLSDQRDSLLNLEARTGSGRISFTGQANLFAWDSAPEQPEVLTWMPTLEGQIYLENVGANALARLIPDSAIMPEGGSISGTIDLELAEQKMDCFANLNIRNATFTANPASRFVKPGETSEINEDLAKLKADGQYQFSCGGQLGNDTYRPFQAFQTNLIRQSVENSGSKSVQALANVEHLRYSESGVDGAVTSEVDKILDRADEEWSDWLRKKVRRLRQ